MGCLFAALLTKAKEEVWLIDNHKERAERIRKEGIRVEGISKFKIQNSKFKITLAPREAGVAELLIIFVKAYDTEKAVIDALPTIGKETTILTLQNGLGNIEKIKETLSIQNSKFKIQNSNPLSPHLTIQAGTTSQGATVLGPGYIRHAGEGETIIGELSGKITPRLKSIARVFNSAGIETKLTDNLEGLIWSKLLINVGINAICSIIKVKNGSLLENAEALRLMEGAVSEAVRITEKKGITLLYDNPQEKVKSICQATKENINSMLQDILNKKRTEIDFINGAIVEEGENLGIPTPVNKTLTCLVRAMENVKIKNKI